MTKETFHSCSTYCSIQGLVDPPEPLQSCQIRSSLLVCMVMAWLYRPARRCAAKRGSTIGVGSIAARTRFFMDLPDILSSTTPTTGEQAHDASAIRSRGFTFVIIQLLKLIYQSCKSSSRHEVDHLG